MKNKIDFQKILDIGFEPYQLMQKNLSEVVTDMMREVVRQAIPIILKEAAERAESEFIFEGEIIIDHEVNKESITSLETELIKQLTE